MNLPAIGSLTQAGRAGRPGVVMGVQPLGEARDGRQLVALKIKRPETAQPSAPAAADMAAAIPERGHSGSQRSPTAGTEPARGTGPEVQGARGYEELSSEERSAVDRLRRRDQQVRQEEKAHAGAAGDLAGPISYIYQRGPDGRLYAVGGSVPIRSQVTSSDPEQAQRVGVRLAAAAHAATNPSGADLAAARKGYSLQGQESRLNKVEKRQDEPPRGSAIDIAA